ncbi:2-isopropylmalate synthase [archaeon HR06]|nr:2-isopropylmalate synthase [archaeon HR06]
MEDTLSIAKGFAEYYNKSNHKARSVKILDSTLREGEQGSGIYFTLGQKVQIAWMLDYFGVDAIEISPIISKEHEEATTRIIKAGLKAKIVAHLRALPSDIDVALKCDAKCIAMYHSVSDLHLNYKLRVSREKALERMVKAIDYAKAHGLELRMTMEDASRADPAFLLKACKVVEEAKADRISIPDTVGVMKPSGMYNLVKMVKEKIRIPIDVHCHNDLGLALANSLAGYEAGADQIHVTVNGIGERVGITSLDELVMALKVLYNLDLKVRYEMLKELSETIAHYAKIKIQSSKPLVGENAYKHKAGTHIAAVIRNPQAYEVIPPSFIGNKRKLIFGELSGKNGAAFLMKILGLDPNPELAIKLAKGLKDLRIGDLFEIEFSEDLEREVLKVDSMIEKGGEG